jgi:hypothetical protein
MRRGRSGIRRGHREMVETTLDRIAARNAGVVVHHGGGESGTSGQAICFDGPFRGTLGDSNVAKAFACRSAECGSAASRARVRAMRGLRGGHRACSADVILATGQCIFRGIGSHARRKCWRRIHAALFAGILRIGSRAIGHDVGAVFLYIGGAASATSACSARAAAGAAGAAGAACFGAAGAARPVCFLGVTTDDDGSRCEQDAYEKNASFGHPTMIAQFRFGRQVAFQREVDLRTPDEPFK